MSQLVIFLPAQNQKEFMSEPFKQQWIKFLDDLFAGIYSPDMRPKFKLVVRGYSTEKENVGTTERC